jgi:glycosyltransferase involved in cell wall biosynthesis
MGKRFIIEVNYGGLGDHLFNSHLPKIAEEVGGFDAILVSRQSEFRHPLPMEDAKEDAGRSTPAVTVMMAVYNARPYLAEAIDGVLAQTFRDWELIALNDGSTDGSLEILRRYADGDPRIRVISRSNKGVVATRNELLAAATAPLVAVHDADDISLPNRLELQVRYFDQHPECVALGARVTLFGPNNLVLGEEFDLATHDQIDRANMEARGSAIAHSASMYRTAPARQVGGYREEYPPSEDLDLWLRLAEIGRLANLPDMLVRYRLSEGSLSHSRAFMTRLGAHRAMADAHRRRGLPFDLPEPVPGPEISSIRQWTLTALGKRRFGSARRLALMGLRRKPFRWASWRLLLATLAGPHAQRIVGLRDRILRRPRTPGSS